MAAVLICAKAVAYFATGSVSLLSTLVDSLLDLAASMINLIAIRHAAQPADQEHRFGHGKAEPLAGLGQAAFIAGSAIFVLVQAGERLVQRAPMTNEAIGIGVMVLSILLTLGLVVFHARSSEKQGRSRSAPTRCTTGRIFWSTWASSARCCFRHNSAGGSPTRCSRSPSPSTSCSALGGSFPKASTC